MKKMRGLKTAVSVVAAASLLVSSMSAMAASYTTKTTYKANGKIAVQAKATGLNEGDVVTYVATTSDNVTEDSVVYLNQGKADTTGNVTFNYTTDVTNIDASMFFGGSTESTKQAASEEGYTITVKVGENTETVVVPEYDNAGTVIRKISLNNISLSGKKVTGISFEGAAISEYAANADTIVLYTDAINRNGTLTVTAEEDTEAFSKPVLGSVAAIDANGNLTVAAKAVSGSTFGIVLYKDSEPSVSAPATASFGTNQIVLPALGKNAEGIFAIVYEGLTTDLTDYTGWNVKAYALNGGTVEYSDSALTLN